MMHLEKKVYHSVRELELHCQLFLHHLQLKKILYTYFLRMIPFFFRSPFHIFQVHFDIACWDFLVLVMNIL